MEDSRVLVKRSEYHTRINWVNENGGRLTAILQKGNGVEWTMSKDGVKIQDAEKVGEKLLDHLKKKHF